MALYKAKAEELRAALSTALEPVFVAQIALLKDGALSRAAGAPPQPSPFCVGPPCLTSVVACARARQMRWRATSGAC